ncbi:MAG: hypothetical protein IVW55_06130 [Chloroflexi bacterium]|nr:hypothetical protein [Chloroflexota bacterium]
MHAIQISDFIIRISRKLIPGETTADGAELNDRAYTEALLDLQLRYFLQAEYGKEEPSSDVLPQVLRAIHLYKEEEAKRSRISLKTRMERIVGQLGRGLAVRYRGMAGAGTGRILSGGLVTALLMLATWPGMMQILDNSHEVTLHRSNMVGESAGSVAPTSPVVERPTSPAATEPALPVAGQQISPGRIYVDPRLRLEQKTGEDLGVSIEPLDTSNQRSTPRDIPSEKTAQPQTEPDYIRPLTGPE